MKVVASYLTKREAKNVSRAFPNAEVSLMSSKNNKEQVTDKVKDKPYWCVQV